MFHPGKCAVVGTGGKPVMVVGEIHPKLRQELKLKRNAVIVTGALADLEALAAGAAQCRPIPSLPGATRDLALVADKAVPAADIEAAIARRAKSLLAGLRLFDVYEGDRLPAGKRSLAYTLELPEALQDVGGAVAGQPVLQV